MGRPILAAAAFKAACRARPRILQRFHYQTCGDRILFDVKPNPIELSRASNQVVVALVLPKRLPTAAQFARNAVKPFNGVNHRQATTLGVARRWT